MQRRYLCVFVFADSVMVEFDLLVPDIFVKLLFIHHHK